MVEGKGKVVLVKMAARFMGQSEEDRFISVLPQVIKEARKTKGFVAVDFWRNEQDRGLLLEESYWESWEAALAWKDNEFHKHLQRLAYGRLVMENTTTWWSMEKDIKLYVRCPICDHADTRNVEPDDTFKPTQNQNRCEKCGYMFPAANADHEKGTCF